MKTPRLASVLLAALVLAACESDPVEISTATVIDSAGVSIVTSTAPQWGPGEEWRLTEEPIVTIGQLAGPEDQILYRVRGAVRLTDGRIVVADNGSHTLRFYDELGRHLFSTGGPGQGPGEFEWLGSVWQAADSLFVFDIRNMRVSVFSAAGEFGRSYRVVPTPDGAFGYPVGMFGDRHLLVERGAKDEELSTGFSRENAVYLRYSPTGEPGDTVGRFPGDERYIGKSGELTYSTEAPFGHTPSIVPVGDHLVYGSGYTYEIQVFTSRGSLERIIRRPVPNPPLSSAEIAEYREEEFSPDAHPIWRDLYAQMEFPSTKPAYGRLVVDSDGNLWAAEYTHEYMDIGRWDVFGPDGRYLGGVETPPSGRVMEIGSDYVIGVWANDLDVEQVRVYRILKPEPGTPAGQRRTG